MRFFLTTLLLFSLFSLTACQNEEPATKEAGAEKPAPHQVVKEQPLQQPLISMTPGAVLFDQPVEPRVFELPSFAVSAWRDVSADKPALVLYSIHPLLEPVKPDRVPGD